MNTLEEFWIDTNVIIRFLTNDHATQSKIAAKLFKRSRDGEFKLYISSLVISECTYVLSGHPYNYPKKTISTQLIGLGSSNKNIVFEEPKVVQESLSMYSYRDIDFVDAYVAIKAKHHKPNDVLTWNINDLKNLGSRVKKPQEVVKNETDEN